MGIRLEFGSSQVAALAENGPAAESGKIDVGDRIVAANGILFDSFGVSLMTSSSASLSRACKDPERTVSLFDVLETGSEGALCDLLVRKTDRGGLMCHVSLRRVPSHLYDFDASGEYCFV